METPYQPPNILRLFGITLRDYVPVEDVADERLLAAGVDGRAADPEDPSPESIHPPDKIPRVFTGLEDWPHSTNLRCWQCDFTFDDRPKFVPTHVREAENGGIEFGVLGNMCTFNCAELWISIHYAGKEDQRWRAQDNLCLVYFLFTGRRVARIRPAPHKTELRQYGGELDEDAFWKKMRDLDSLAGLRDHTPGSVVPERDRAPAVPERDRVKTALATLRVNGGLGGAPALRAVAAGGDTLGSRRPAPGEPLAVGQKSVWGVCGLPHEADPAPGAESRADAPLASGAQPDSIAIPPTSRKADNVASRADTADELEALLADRADFDDDFAQGDPGGGPPLPRIEGPVDLDDILGVDRPDDAAPAAAAEPPAAAAEPSPSISNDDMDALLAELGAL